jgi:hypothetical protein
MIKIGVYELPFEAEIALGEFALQDDHFLRLQSPKPFSLKK